MNCNYIISSVLILFLTSCTDPNQPCEDSFVNKYRAVQATYSAVYDENATSTDLESLKGSVRSFLSSHRDVKCTMDGGVVDVTAEADALMTEVDNKIFKSIDKVVYGVDNRLDVEDSPNENYRNWAQATASMIPNYRITGAGIYLSQSLGSSLSLCPGERFYEQIVPASCSGFLIGKDILVTAGHCITSLDSCSNYKWVFNFRDGDNSADSDYTFTCIEVLGREQNNTTGADYAIVRLDREVQGITPLKFRVEGKIRDGASLVVIGNPSGLPTKIADGASVRTNSDDKYFVANLDTFGGNSGSAVFDIETGLVEGILVRGENDYNWNGSCRVVNNCSDTGCGGEDVTRMTSLAGIPAELLIVDGGWSEWSAWTACANGEQSHVRSCTNPVPSNGGVGCVGDTSELRECVNHTLEQVFAGIYDDKSFAQFDQYGLLSFLGFEQDDHVLLGRKFFGLCGMHSAQVNDKSWLGSYIVPCSERNSLHGVYSGFESIILAP